MRHYEYEMFIGHNLIKNMKNKNFENMTWEDFTILEAPRQETKRRVRASFYRTKPGCYTPPAYQVDRIKLSEVL